MLRLVPACFLWFSLSLRAAEPPPVPQVRPEAYPPGTLFSVVVSPRKEIGWAPSQDPALPPVTRLDGTRPPVLPFDILNVAATDAKEWAVERNGGHHTIAQLMHFHQSIPEMQARYLNHQSYIERDHLRGYVAATVTFRKLRGAWVPEMVGWKSDQLNLANVRQWQSAKPPLEVQTDTFVRLTLAINRLEGTMIPCEAVFPSVRRLQNKN